MYNPKVKVHNIVKESFKSIIICNFLTMNEFSIIIVLKKKEVCVQHEHWPHYSFLIYRQHQAQIGEAQEDGFEML